MIPKIKSVLPKKDFVLCVEFDDGKICEYDAKIDIQKISQFAPLKTQAGLFESAQLDESRTVVFWNDKIDLPSDAIYEYGRAKC